MFEKLKKLFRREKGYWTLFVGIPDERCFGGLRSTGAIIGCYTSWKKLEKDLEVTRMLILPVANRAYGRDDLAIGVIYHSLNEYNHHLEFPSTWELKSVNN